MNPSRSYDFAHLALDNVERIEVLRGPQSTLYGSDALGGVINILTRRGQGKPRLSLSPRRADRTGRWPAAWSFGGSTGACPLFPRPVPVRDPGILRRLRPPIPATRRRTDTGTSASPAGLGLASKNGLEADLMVRAVSAKTDLDNFGGPGGDDPNSTQRLQVALPPRPGPGALRRRPLGAKARAVLSSARRRDHDNPVDDLHPFDSEKGTYQSDRAKIDWQNNVFLAPSHTLTFGADLAREQGESQYTSFSAWGPYDSPFPRRTADQAGLYVQDQVRRSPAGSSPRSARAWTITAAPGRR